MSVRNARSTLRTDADNKVLSIDVVVQGELVSRVLKVDGTPSVVVLDIVLPLLKRSVAPRQGERVVFTEHEVVVSTSLEHSVDQRRSRCSDGRGGDSGERECDLGEGNHIDTGVVTTNVWCQGMDVW